MQHTSSSVSDIIHYDSKTIAVVAATSICLTIHATTDNNNNYCCYDNYSYYHEYSLWHRQ